jgi:DNA-binding transcriptional ArsR family regulator
MRHTVNDASCELLGGFFATLAHATRMRILCALQHAPRTVTEIAASAGITITNASQHLRMMREGGAVVAEKHAQNVYYRIADARILEAMSLIREALSERLRQNADRASGRTARRVSRRVLELA